MTGTVAGLPGITAKSAVVLDAAIDFVHGLEVRTVSQFGREVGGLFIQTPEVWELTRGWTLTPEFYPFPRKASSSPGADTGEGDLGRLTITPVEMYDKAEMLMELRSMIVNTAIAREGWDPIKTSWRDVVRARVEAMWEAEQLTTEHYRDVEQAVDVTTYTVEEHLRGGFWKPVAELGENFVLPHIGAYDYLMLTGPRVLVGMLHTHPRGSAEPSPEDMVGAQTFMHYQKAMSYNPEHLSDAGFEGGGCETGAPTQHWILALNTGGFVKALVKFVAGRRLAVIEGNFLQ